MQVGRGVLLGIAGCLGKLILALATRGCFAAASDEHHLLPAIRTLRSFI